MLFRKIAVLGAALTLFACAEQGRAQLGLYATITGGRIGGIQCQDPQQQCASNDGVVRPYGTTFGGYYEFRSYGPARVGFDVRGSVLNTNKPADYYASSTDEMRKYAALGGLRGSFTTPFKYIRPYAQIDAGFARSNAVGTGSFNPTVDYRNYTQVEGVVGVDVPLFSALELRAIEFTGGELFGPSSHSTESISAGVVLRFGR